MAFYLILASRSPVRAEMLRRAAIPFDAIPAGLDEDAVKLGLLSEGASPRDLADSLAEMKARKLSDKSPGRMVLGCDQVLDFDGRLISKPETPEICKEQLADLSGNAHALHSAAVICLDGQPIWRHVGTAQLRMRTLSAQFIDDYVSRNWPDIRDSVGGYKLEEEGVRLFASVRGDFFHVLGLPLLELISYLVARGDLDS